LALAAARRTGQVNGAQAREAVGTLRDAVREGRRIDFRGCDELVMAIHNALDLVFCADCKVGAATDPLQDCDWPMCGCDPHADKVIAALQECDLLMPRGEKVK
jgi:hypothetical protein